MSQSYLNKYNPNKVLDWRSFFGYLLLLYSATYWVNLLKYSSVNSWTQVRGEVVHRFNYNPSIYRIVNMGDRLKYTYLFGGTVYESNEYNKRIVTLCPIIHTNDCIARKLYGVRLGDVLDVYVNPKNPHESMLYIDFSDYRNEALFYFVIGSFLVLLSVIRKRSKRMQ